MCIIISKIHVLCGVKRVAVDAPPNGEKVPGEVANIARHLSLFDSLVKRTRVFAKIA
jgi:hypothetical protein